MSRSPALTWSGPASPAPKVVEVIPTAPCISNVPATSMSMPPDAPLAPGSTSLNRPVKRCLWGTDPFSALCCNKYLTWAFVEAAHFAVHYDPQINRPFEFLEVYCERRSETDFQPPM